MKKLKIILVGLLCLLTASCSNDFAKREYDADEKISQTADRYTKQVSVSNSTNRKYSLTVSKFDGRETIWKKRVSKSRSVEINVSLSLSKGQVKIVHIDKDGNVTTVIECTPDTSTDGFITETVSLKSGKNRFKIVGYDCEDIDLKIEYAEP